MSDYLKAIIDGERDEETLIQLYMLEHKYCFEEALSESAGELKQLYLLSLANGTSSLPWDNVSFLIVHKYLTKIINKDISNYGESEQDRRVK